MAERFTRKNVREILGDACTDEIENKLMALHIGVVDPMKDELAEYKAKAETLEAVTKERDALKAGGDYKQKFEDEHKAFEDYKKGITAKETRAAKEKAVRAYLESKSITGNNLEIAMRGCGAEIDAAELDGEKIKDTKAFDDLVGGTFKGLVVKSSTVGVNTANPPANNGGTTMTKEQIMAIKDTAARQKAISDNHELFGF